MAAELHNTGKRNVNVNKNDHCINCGNPKSEHSKFDTFCLQLNNWSLHEFEAEEKSLDSALAGRRTQPRIATTKTKDRSAVADSAEDELISTSIRLSA